MKSTLLDCIEDTSARFRPPVRRKGTHLLLLFIGLLQLGLTGCAAKRLRTDYTAFERVYAETSNREMLLNLARLENRDPTYFFKVGQITSNWKMQSSLAGAGSYAVSSSNPHIGGPAGGGTPLVNYENDPVFTFIPVNDETNAQLLLKPIPAETFYFLYEQGWRVDQLLRLMVDRIELTRITTQGSTQVCTVETIRNAPPTAPLRADGTPDYSHNQVALSSYITFLRINAIAYWLQKNGFLLLRGKDTFVPYALDPDSGLDADATANAPKAADFVNAAQKNAVWELVETKEGTKTVTKWVLGEKVFAPMFSLYPTNHEGSTVVPRVGDIEKAILNDPDMKDELSKGPALQEVLEGLAAGFTIEGSTNKQDSCNPTSGQPQVSAHLVMRSLLGVMAAAAQEQIPFEALAHANPTVPNSPFLTQAEKDELKNPPDFRHAVPVVERLPLLHLTGEIDDQKTQPVIQLNYRGKNYYIADDKKPEYLDNQYWNRDVFRLIDQLTSQVTVDISKFPLTEILQ